MPRRPGDPPNRVLAAYQLDDQDTVVRPLAGGRTSSTWHVTTSQAELVLHALPNHLRLERAQLVAAAQSQAAAAGLAPELLTTKQGAPLAVDHGQSYTLSRYITGGRALRIAHDPTSARRLGTALGRLHTALADLQPPGPAGTGWHLPGTEPLRQALASHRRPGCTHPATVRYLETKIRWAANLSLADRAWLDALPCQVIHGDIHPGNVLACDGQVGAFVDFDQARSFPRIYELTRALIYCTHPAGPPASYAPRVAAFLYGYQIIYPLTANETAALVRLFQAVQTLDPYGLHPCDGVDPALLRFGHARFALLYWLRSNGHHITRIAAR